MKKTKQVKRKLSFEKLRIAKLNNDSIVKIRGGDVRRIEPGTGSAIDTVMATIIL